jgi:hypothetical protein
MRQLSRSPRPWWPPPAAFVTALALLPPALVLPVAGAGLLVAAATMAIIAWASPFGVRLIFWDFAGLLTLFALGAALMGEPEQARTDRTRQDVTWICRSS